jgi:sugar phosphate isomerase/epimerase
MSAVDKNACRLSCRYEVLPGERAFDRILNAQRFGFDAVSLPGRFLSDYLDELRTCLDDLPIPLAAMSLGFTGSLVSPDESVRAQCRESFLRLFDICAELGVSHVNVPPVLIQDNPVRLKDEAEQDALLVEQLPALGDEAKQRGLLFLLEPVNKYETEYLYNVPHAARICERVNHSHVGLTCDFFHMQMEELNIPASLRQAGKWIKHVHVAENTRVEPGPGSMNFTPGFAALKELKYTGIIEIECRWLSGPGEEVLPRSVEYLRKKWAEA